MRIWTIARLTYREAVRRKIALTALLLGLAFLALYNLGFFYIKQQTEMFPPSSPMVGRSINNFMLLAGLYVVNFLSLAMAALVSAGTLAGEIGSGTIQSIVTKPIRRIEVVLGKWLGFAGLLLLYVLLMAGGLILSTWVQSGYTPPHIPAGMGLMYLESLVMVTITLMCSSSLSTLATGGVVFGLYGIAFAGGWVEQIGSYLNNATAIRIGVLSSLIMPSEAIWRRAAYEMTSPLMQMLTGSPFAARSVPSPLMLAYSGIYVIVALLLAVRLFGHRDL